MENRITLGETANNFLASLKASEREKSQPEILAFVRWFGVSRILKEISIPEVGNYAEQVGAPVPDPSKKLEPVRLFLIYCRESKLIPVNMAVHLRVKRTGPKLQARKAQTEELVFLSAEGYAQLEAELEGLKKERPGVAEELRKAAADKDFRENAPLDAAREHQGQIEARIRALEHLLKSATVANRKQAVTSKAGLGDLVVLRDLSSDEAMRYTLVDPREANPLGGKLSVASPIGRAVLGKETGVTVEVSAPRGVMHYRIEAVERA